MELEREWLDVAFSEKEEAKRFGARWDPQARRWYLGPRGDRAALARFAPRPPLPMLLPGEIRSGYGEELCVDLVPKSCWFTNVRACVEPRDWERLRRLVIERAGDRCEACDMPPDADEDRRMECHERWAYLKGGVQKLIRLVCLCTPCHTATHYGLARLRGQEVEAVEQLMRVEGMTWDEVEEHVESAFNVWHERNQVQWTLDLSILTDAGIAVRPPPAAHERAAIAQAETQRRPI